MKKRIQKIGTSMGVVFNKEEQEIYGLEIGKIVDLSEMRVLEENKKEDKKHGH